MINLQFYNITIVKAKESKEVVVKGEVTNRSDRSYNTVALRIILFVKNISIANVIVLVNGLSAGATKEFEKKVEELQYDAIAKDITRYEVYAESAY